MLNRYEFNKISSIYQQEILKYLKEYKIVNVRVVLTELKIEDINGKREQPPVGVAE